MIYIILLVITLLFISNSIVFLGLFQQNGYKTEKYLLNLKRHYLKTLPVYLEYLSIIVMLFYSFYKEWYLGLLLIIILFTSFLLSEPLIIYPKITKRMIRQLITLIVIFIVPFFFVKNHLFFFLVSTIFLPFIIELSGLINIPIEKKITNYYKQVTFEKLKRINPLIIGVTGSFGKTTTKNIIHSIIYRSYYTYSTPKSYNTPMGISKAVSKMNDLTEVFISELAATKTNDIKELVDFVKVDIGIITDIGYQHMESFKTIENVLQTKLEILASTNLKQLIINNDNQYLKEHIYPENIEIIRVGINNDSDYMAKNIILTNNGLSFDVYNKEIFLFKVDTILLGRHNIYNLLFGIVVGRLLNISVEEIKRNIRNLKPVDNRLSIKNIGKIQIINDAFNSNIKGFINAIEILKYSKNKKILITPGLVDLGELLEEMNREISKYLIEGIDYIYLVENKSSKYLQEYFQQTGFKSFEVVSSFQKAYKKAINKYEESTILIENDLPDNYLRR